MKKTLIAATLASLALSAPATAQIAGKNVVLVHGFQPAQLSNPPTSNAAVSADGANYWQEFWGARAQARIDWDSTQRIEGNGMLFVYEQLKALSQSGLCAQGCVFVTHSTGDLVTRYLLENQARWLAADGLQPLQVAAVIDLMGAGGGTELADIALSVANNNSWWAAPAKAAVRAVFGIDPTPQNLGVINDLTTNQARSIAMSPNGIPRLRVVGGGSDFFGTTGAFISGTDDGVVPAHSACGATQAAAFDSCSRSIAMNGRVGNASGPAALWFNHYPILMSESAAHNGMRGSQGNTRAVPVVNNVTLNGFRVAFDSRTYEQRAWWQLWGAGDTYIEVPGSDRRNLSELVYTSLNR